jgi:hypothetical protein
MSQQDYYSDSTRWGESQYVTLADVVNNFMLMYVGYDKLIDNIERYNVLFHAKRAVQELNYDAFRQPKVLEVAVDEDLKVILPSDFVNYVRVSYEYDGVLFLMHESSRANSAKRYDQNTDGSFVFDVDGNLIEEESELDRIRKTGDYMMYPDPGYWFGRYGYYCDGDWFFQHRYGLDTSEAKGTPTFLLDKEAGVINVSSGIAGDLVVIEYISDGLASSNPADIKVHKLAEEFIYAYIKWCVLNNRVGVQEYVVRRAREEKSATLRNAKIRLSNINPRRLLMPLRGKDNFIK